MKRKREIWLSLQVLPFLYTGPPIPCSIYHHINLSYNIYLKLIYFSLHDHYVNPNDYMFKDPKLFFSLLFRIKSNFLTCYKALHRLIQTKILSPALNQMPPTHQIHWTSFISSLPPRDLFNLLFPLPGIPFPPFLTKCLPQLTKRT